MHRRYEPSNIPIEILRSFIGILDAGSFTKAAVRLNITQPAISAQIKRMQVLVGQELFQKEGVGITLTEKGETVSRYARRILALNDQILWSGRCEKRFRIGLPSTFSGHYLGVLKSALEAENFNSVQIVCDRSESLLKGLRAGFFDAALAFSADDAAETAAALEWKEPLVWVCHPDFVLSPGAPLPLLSWPNSVPDQIAVRTCERVETRYSTVFVGDQLLALIEALQIKLGYLCIAERSVPAGMKIATDYFLPKLPPMHAGIYKSPDLSDPRLDALVKCMIKVFDPVRAAKTEGDELTKIEQRSVSSLRNVAAEACSPRKTANAAGRATSSPVGSMALHSKSAMT
jgi:DNA-binding transcriptional LysR family regulator